LTVKTTYIHKVTVYYENYLYQISSLTAGTTLRNSFFRKCRIVMIKALDYFRIASIYIHVIMNVFWNNNSEVGLDNFNLNLNPLHIGLEKK